MNWKNMILGVGLLSICALSWAWLLGAFALPTELQAGASEMLLKWTDPGILTFPALIGSVFGIVGISLMLSSKKRAQSK